MRGLTHKQLRTIGLVLGVLAAIVLAGLSAGSSVLYASNYEATYWNNRNLSGEPVLRRSEPAIDHDWGAGSPEPGVVNIDNFSARWVRTYAFPTSGVYRFKATSDDGMRVWLDNTLIIDAWFESPAHTVEANVNVTAGNHQLRIEYFEAGGNARAGFTWELVSSSGGGTGDPGGQFKAWRGEYYNNVNLAGTPAMVRDDANISFNWGLGAPDPRVTADLFSVRWTRTVPLEAGRYRFTTTTDDGVRLWVNGQLIIDKWQVQAATSFNAEIDLPAGNIPIKMEYFENFENAGAQLAFVKVGGGTGGDPSITQWRAEYFNNMSLAGAPAVVRNDANIDFNWGYGSPDPRISADHFSVRWTRTLDLQPGTYRFTARTDDGVRLFVNGRIVIDAWFDRAVQTSTGDVTVPGGPTQVRMEYYENTLLAEARLGWSRVDGGGTGGPYPTGVVNASYLNVRSGPGVQYGIVSTIRGGTYANLIGRNFDTTWLEIILGNGVRGWVNANFITTSYPIGTLPNTSGSYVAQPTATVTASHLNVRYGPGVGFAAFTVINQGQQVQLIGRDATSTWVKVRLPGGGEGWVNAKYLATSVPVSSLPFV